MNITFFDVETGGFSPVSNPITQIALVTCEFKNNSLIEKIRFSSYIKPYNDLILKEEALKISSISRNVLNNAPDVKQVFLNIKDFLKQSRPSPRKKTILCGHNVTFDISFLKELFAFCGDDLSDHVDSNNSEISHFDTLKLSALKYAGQDVLLNLSECCKRAGIELIDAHGALPDTLATKDLFYWLMQNKSEEGLKIADEFGDLKSIRSQGFAF